jgi:hypothetical protein
MIADESPLHCIEVELYISWQFYAASTATDVRQAMVLHLSRIYISVAVWCMCIFSLAAGVYEASIEEASLVRVCHS